MSFGTWLESDYYETRNELPCACGAVFPRHAARHLSSVFINSLSITRIFQMAMTRTVSMTLGLSRR